MITHNKLGGKDETRCGAESFMMRDGVCDEFTNTEECLFDGGDCCLDRSKIDTSMCRDCTCRTTVNHGNLRTIFKTSEVMSFLDPLDFQRSILKTEITVAEVLKLEVCTSVCLDSQMEIVVNGWMFNANTRTCTCSWLKSTDCIKMRGLLELTSSDDIDDNGLDEVQSFVQVAKVLDSTVVSFKRILGNN